MQIEKLRGQALDRTLMRFLHLKIEKNVINSFDLCTVNELQSLSQRLQVAKMIKQRVYLRITIEKESGASHDRTISR